MFEYRQQSRVCVSPKSVLAERMLRWSDARKAASSEAGQAPEFQFQEFQLRECGVRSVGVQKQFKRFSASSPLSCGHKAKSDLPRKFASSWEAPKAVLKNMVRQFKRAASAKVFERMAERLATGPKSLVSGTVVTSALSTQCCVPSYVRVASTSIMRPRSRLLRTSSSRH